MKVIFLKDNPSGKKNQIKEVSRGHALNYLIPQKIAVLATDDLVQKINAEQEKIVKEKKELNQQLDKKTQKLKSLKLEITAKANPEGHLFGGISNDDIIKLLAEKHNLELDKNALDLPHHLKEIGEHKIKVKLNDQEVNLAVNIKAEK